MVSISCSSIKRKQALGVTVDKARSDVHPCFYAGWAIFVHTALHKQGQGLQTWSPSGSAAVGLVGFAHQWLTSGARKGAEALDGSSLSQSICITAWSRMGPPSSSTPRSPWLWVESDPGPHRQGSHLDGSRLEVAAYLNQDEPGEQRQKLNETHLNHTVTDRKTYIHLIQIDD